MPKKERVAQREAAEADKAARAADAAERREAASWSSGTDAKGSAKKADAERKAAERDAKRSEKAALEAQEAAEASGMKNKPKKTSKGDKKSSEMKELEAQLLAMEVDKKKKDEKKRGSSTASKKQKSARTESDSEEDVAPIEQNPNRIMTDIESAKGMDQALDLLGGGAATDKHPERRRKALYKVFEERMLSELKDEMPGLKLSQYKDRIFALWQKSPENPANQAQSGGGAGT